MDNGIKRLEWGEVSFRSYLTVLEVELDRVGVNFMAERSITVEEVANGQESGMSPQDCAEIIWKRLNSGGVVNDATNDTEYKDTKG